MEEYGILTGTPGKCQTTLNQWRHIYDLDIISMVVNPQSNEVAILLTRKVR